MKKILSNNPSAIASRRYRAKHREQARAANRAYYKRNAKILNKRTSAWKKGNAAYAETQRRWRKKNKDYMKQYYAKHREHIAELNRKRYAKLQSSAV